MFEIEIDRSFSAAHQLRGYNGDCCNLHGHNYKVTVTVRSAEQDEIGIALDFKKLKAGLDELLAELDHKFLNDVPGFESINPTSENIAKTIFDRLASKLNDSRIRVHKVRISENKSSGASYFED